MFSNLMDLKLQRTWKQAIGFYFVYIVVIGIIGVLIDWLYGLTIGTESDVTYDRIGHFVAILVAFGLSITIVYKKNAFNFKGISLVLLTGLLSLILGSLLFGVIPIAILSSLKDNS